MVLWSLLMVGLLWTNKFWFSFPQTSCMIGSLNNQNLSFLLQIVDVFLYVKENDISLIRVCVSTWYSAFQTAVQCIMFNDRLFLCLLLLHFLCFRKFHCIFGDWFLNIYIFFGTIWRRKKGTKRRPLSPYI